MNGGCLLNLLIFLGQERYEVTRPIYNRIVKAGEV